MFRPVKNQNNPVIMMFDFTRRDRERRLFFRKKFVICYCMLPAWQEAPYTVGCDWLRCDDEARGNSALAEIDVIY